MVRLGGFRGGGAGGQLISTNCLRAPGLKFRFGREEAGWLAGRWSCQISENDHFHWNLCWQLAAANLPTSHPCQLRKPTAKVLESPRGPQGRHNNSAAAHCCKKKVTLEFAYGGRTCEHVADTR